MNWEVLEADCVEQMRQMDEASVDAIVCDPPYGLEFMGKEWDQFRIDDTGTNRHRGERAGEHGAKGGTDRWGKDGKSIPSSRTSFGGGKRPHTFRCVGCGKRDQFRNDHGCEAEWRRELIDPFSAPPTMLAFQEWSRMWATEALRVLKPGGHLLAAGGTRTFHRLVSAIEDAGFEIRDCIAHMYGSGFPKSHNGEWGGTALKPGFEPWTLARKPLVGTVEQNWREHGTGALNIDGCRIEAQGRPQILSDAEKSENVYGDGLNGSSADGTTDQGRWPANVVLDPEAAAALDEQSGERSSGSRAAGEYGRLGYQGWDEGPMPAVEGDSGGASRFFYVAKSSRSERNAGLDGFEESDEFRTQGSGRVPLSRCPEHGTSQPSGQTTYACGCERVWDGREGRPVAVRNVHPTVKPIALMRWLVRLVCPVGGTVLDPFTGSGTTGIAAVIEGFDFIGIEREPEYVEIAKARIAWWEQHQGREAEEVLAESRRSENLREQHETAGQMGLLE